MKRQATLLVRLQLAIYNLLITAAIPLLRRKLRRRALTEPLYGAHINERFGHYATAAHAANTQAVPTIAQSDHVKDDANQPRVWIHAVSLGETLAAKSVIDALRQQMPAMRLILTHGTATGRAAGTALLHTGDAQVWQPWDTPLAVSRFLDQHQPHIALLMETEVWPNLVLQSRSRGLPVMLINARMSEKTLRQTLRFSSLARHVYGLFTHILPQNADDAARLSQLSHSGNVRAPLGNIKFDAQINAEHLATGHAHRHAATRPVIMLASSREGEEAQLVAALRDLSRAQSLNVSALNAPQYASTTALNFAQWLIVPRHPQRFDEVATLLETNGFPVLRRSHYASATEWLAQSFHITPSTVLLGDSLGEMALYYGAASTCLLGGSFADLGGQNLIEAAAASCPVVMGPSTFNFATAASQALTSGAAAQVHSMADGVQTALNWVTDATPLAQRQAAALAFSQSHTGSSLQTARIVCATLDQTTWADKQPEKING